MNTFIGSWQPSCKQYRAYKIIVKEGLISAQLLSILIYSSGIGHIPVQFDILSFISITLLVNLLGTT